MTLTFRHLLPLLALTTTGAAAQACRNNATLPLPAQTIFQFAKGDNFTFFENIVSRANGDLLVTMAVPQPNVYLLQNPGSACPSMSQLFRVPGVNGTDGIVEIASRPDVFAVVAGNLSLSGDPANGVAGSWSVWEVDLGGGAGGGNAPAPAVDCSSSSPDPAPPAVTTRKIADFPMAPRLNGAAAVPGTPAVLVGDSQLGVAFRLDTVTGQITTALDFPEMKPVPNAGSVDDALGLNGMKIGRDGYLYFTNAAARTINRVQITPDGTGAAAGAAVEMIARVPESGWMDDLDLRDDGSMWVTTNAPTNSLLAIQTTVAGQSGAMAQFKAPILAAGSNNSLPVAGDTAAVFGRGNAGTRMLYVACGSGDEPAKVVRVDTSSCQ